MTTLHEFERNTSAIADLHAANAQGLGAASLSIATGDKSVGAGAERRRHRRHDLEAQNIRVERWHGKKHASASLGTVVDLSSGGVRIRTTQSSIRPDQQIRLKLELPVYAGICPFVDTSNGSLKPRNQWVGWMAVNRVQEMGNGQYDVAGRLVDMEDLDRGMLGLYLSTQPLAA